MRMIENDKQAILVKMEGGRILSFLKGGPRSGASVCSSDKSDPSSRPLRSKVVANPYRTPPKVVQ